MNGLRMRTPLRTAASPLPESLLFDLCLGFLLAGVLAAILYRAVPPRQFVASFAAAAARVFRRARQGGSASRSAIQERWAANEFAFDRAIQAYEELIDGIAERMR